MLMTFHISHLLIGLKDRKIRLSMKRSTAATSILVFNGWTIIEEGYAMGMSIIGKHEARVIY